MSTAKVSIADLMYKGDFWLASKFNAVRRRYHLPPVRNVTDAVAQLLDDDVSQQRKSRLAASMEEFAAERGTTVAALLQWMVMLDWLREREACMHPQGTQGIDSNKLQQLKKKVQSEQAYSSVRDGAMVLIAAAEEIAAMKADATY